MTPLTTLTKGQNIYYVSIGSYQWLSSRLVSPLYKQWRYRSLAYSHWYVTMCYVTWRPLPTLCYIIFVISTATHFDGLMQERRNSIANALELHLSCTKPSIWGVIFTATHFDGLMQERRNSIANALELRLSCTKPSIWGLDTNRWNLQVPNLQMSCSDFTIWYSANLIVPIMSTKATCCMMKNAIIHILMV